MSSFLVSLKAITPMFCMLAIGLLVRKSSLLTEKELQRVNNLVFRVLFPFLMFANIYNAKISDAINPELILFVLGAIGVVYAGALGFTLAVEKDNCKRGAMIQALYRSNFAIMGLPLVANIFGGENLGMTAVMLAVVVPIYNVLAVITLETFRGKKIHAGKILLGIVKNPLIIGAVSGILAVLLQIRLPEVIDSTVSSLSNAATPMALIILGATFSFSTVTNCRRNLLFCVVGRLLVIPGICLTAAALLGFRGIAFVTLIGLFGTPCAVSSFTMAQQMESDSELAANCVVFTSALSCLTLFFWVFLFKQLGMF